MPVIAQRRTVLRPALVGSVVLAMLVSACALMPHEHAKAPALPSAWRDAPVGANVALTDWWTGFEDPLLDRLVAEALADGPSVRLAALRVQQARAVARSTIANNLPDLTAGGAGQYTQPRTPGASLPNASGGADSEQMIGAYGPRISWEVPLFGRALAAAAGARANNASALADMRGAQVALVADVAQAYVDLRAAQASRAALQQSDRKSTRLNSSHIQKSRMPSSA